MIVPTLRRGNAVCNAPALRNTALPTKKHLDQHRFRDAGASILHSHAGAWERSKIHHEDTKDAKFDLVFFVPHVLRGAGLIIVPTLRRGNAVRNAPALRNTALPTKNTSTSTDSETLERLSCIPTPERIAIYTTFLHYKYNELQSRLTPSPAA